MEANSGKKISNWRDAVRHPYFLLISLPVFLLVSWGLFQQSEKNHELSAQVMAASLRAEEMENELEKLELEMRSIDDGMEAEREARLKMNMRRPGEEVVIIRGEEEMLRRDTSGKEKPIFASSERISNFMSWWRYFFP